MADEDDEKRLGRAFRTLQGIRSEISGVGFFLFLALISMCGMCANIDSVQQELDETNGVLKHTNRELGEIRRTLERFLEQQRAR
jgi:hypothetical protein